MVSVVYSKDIIRAVLGECSPHGRIRGGLRGSKVGSQTPQRRSPAGVRAGLLFITEVRSHQVSAPTRTIGKSERTKRRAEDYGILNYESTTKTTFQKKKE